MRWWGVNSYEGIQTQVKTRYFSEIHHKTKTPCRSRTPSTLPLGVFLFARLSSKLACFLSKQQITKCENNTILTFVYFLLVVFLFVHISSKLACFFEQVTNYQVRKQYYFSVCIFSIGRFFLLVFHLNRRVCSPPKQKWVRR